MIDEKYNFENLGEEKIIFINEFVIDQCQRIDPTLDVPTLNESQRLIAVQSKPHQFYYFLDKKHPLLFLDLKLLIDGV